MLQFTQFFFPSKLTDNAKNLFSIVTASGNIRQLYYLQEDWYLTDEAFVTGKYGTGPMFLISFFESPLRFLLPILLAP
jgi:hypothetical protein